MRIFIRSPKSPDCANDSSDPKLGDFNAPGGVNDSLTGAVNGLDPSGLQIYVAGDQNGYDNATSVNLGNAARCNGLNLGNLYRRCRPAGPVDDHLRSDVERHDQHRRLPSQPAWREALAYEYSHA